MKRIIYILMAVSIICLTGHSCSKSSDDAASEPISQQLVGEWYLTVWNGEAPEDMDIYVSFGADNKFEIYQRMESVKYQKYSGTHKLENNLLSGVYSDGVMWGTKYKIEIDPSGEKLLMTSISDGNDISEYIRTSIPAKIKSGADVVVPVRNIVKRWF